MVARAARYWAVIASAGGGSRMNSPRPKQYLSVRGRSLLEWTLSPFLEAGWVDGLVTVLSRGDSEFARLPLAGHPKIITTAGGASRVESVLAGLHEVQRQSSVPGVATFVFVHDAARPCLTVDDLERLRDEASDDHGGLLALPVTETLKTEARDRASGTVAVNGSVLWRAQSPQLFRLDLLRQALEDVVTRGAAPGDEATAMELTGYKPRLVRGRESNVKVVYPEDLPLAEFWLSREEYLR